MPAALPDLMALIGRHEAQVRAHPRDERSWAVLGAAYVEQGRRTAASAYFPKAEQALRTSLETKPKGNPTALEGLAALANARNDFRTGRKSAEEALKLAPKRWTAYPLLIDSCSGLGDYKASRSALEDAAGLRRRPGAGPGAGTPAARGRGGLPRGRGGGRHRSSRAGDVAGADGPARLGTWVREESLRYYEAALRIDPDRTARWPRRACAGSTQGAARRRCARTGRRSPRSPMRGTRWSWASCTRRWGCATRHETQYALLRERVRTDAAAGVDDELVLGLFEADHGDPEDAVRRLREEWARQPGVAVADALGWALHRAEDEEALKFATQATDKTKGGGVRSALYVYHRGQIERELGLLAPARRHLAESLRINPYSSRPRPPGPARPGRLGEPPAEPPPEPKDETPAETEGAAGPPGAARESGEPGGSAGDPSTQATPIGAGTGTGTAAFGVTLTGDR